MDKSSLGPTTGGLRLGAPGRDRRVPTAGRCLDLEGCLRLRLGGPSLHRGLRRRQRLLIEPRAHVVALLGGFPVALAGREREPLVGFGQVLLHADAARIEDAEIVLAVGDAVVGGLAEPLCRAQVVGLAVDALGVEHGEIVHRLGVAGFAGGEIEAARGIEVLLDPKPLLVEAAEPEMRGHEPLLGGALEPFGGFGEILRDAAAFGVALRDLELGGRIALEGGGAQGATDRCRQLVGAAGRRRDCCRLRGGDRRRGSLRRSSRRGSGRRGSGRIMRG